MDYTWIITAMEVAPNLDGFTNVIVKAYYTVSAYKGVYAASLSSVQTFTLSVNDPFVPYDQLTQDVVVGYVKASMGPEQLEMIEKELAGAIAAQENPPTIAKPLPWA